MDRERVDPRKLTVAEARHVANELWTALKLREWVTYTRDLGHGAGGKLRTVGGGRFPPVVPTTSIEGRGLAGFVLPEPELGVMRGLAFYLSGGAWDSYRGELAEPVRRAIDAELATRGRPRTLYVRQTTPDGRKVLRRNVAGGVTPELAAGVVGAVGVCELWALSAEDVETLMEARPVPNPAVIEDLQSVLLA